MSNVQEVLNSLHSQQSRTAVLNQNVVYYPYGNSGSKNVLESYTPSSPDETLTRILFLGSGDLRNVLHTIGLSCSTKLEDLHIHLNDNHSSVIARNILILHIITASDFNPNDQNDLEYVWNVWYSTQWDASTVKRFSKDVLQLLVHQWKSDILVVRDLDLVDLDKVWKYWFTTFSSMKASTCSQILSQRKEFIAEFFKVQNSKCPSFEAVKKLSTIEEIIPKVVEVFGNRMALAECPSELKPHISKEYHNFFDTGNCEPLKEPKAFINPTLLEVSSNQWKVNLLACPFEGFFPIPYNKLNSTVTNRKDGKILLRHCQTVLKERLVQFRSQKRNITFFFHIDDCLLLSLSNPHLKNHFQVIDTSNVVDHVGLANLLYAASNFLQDGPHSILFVESMNWQSLKSSVLEYVETSLSCPLSMIPTLYGLRLSNHLRLGNAVPINVFRNSTNPVTLVWRKVPSYSANFGLNVSPAIQRALINLQKLCFLVNDEDSYSIYQCGLKKYTPMTFYNLIHSLASRCVLSRDSLRSLMLPHLIPKPLEIAWQTQQDWVTGKEVVLYQVTCATVHSESTFENTSTIRLVLFNHTKMKDANYIDNFHLDWKVSSPKGNVVVSFILSKDHGLPESHFASIIDESDTTFRFSINYLKHFRQTVVKNPSPLKIIPRPLVSITNEVKVLSCSESEDQYEFDIVILGARKKQSYDIALSCERKPPIESSHQLSLKLKNTTGTPLTIQVPWPFLVEDVKPTLHYQKTEENGAVKLILKKSLNDAWPCEFQTRNRWNIDRLIPWKESKDLTEEEIEIHMNMQFAEKEIRSLFQGHHRPSTPLDEVRLVMRLLVDLNIANEFNVFAVTLKDSNATPYFYLRAHPPVRISPLGSPILSLSVADLRLSDKLFARKAESPQVTKTDFSRIFGKKHCPVPIYTIEGIALLRYVFRLNSTKIQPSAWQSSNLPNSEIWLSTFVSPLYMDWVYDFSPKPKEQLTSASNPPSKSSVDGCSHCCSVKNNMKRCVRCKRVLYCDANCQKADWLKHKASCSL